ncbi:Aspartic proteinase CDR1 [Melia azedarach]|uniref:Aspartic proteinase CDR1 n=1 Tax=Melia azedarach TaxID=155640 RepID=A0ACC1X3T7_MELAZ|nr:Aspartic proteinase CDR1 [Melia azedarach]
MASIIHFQSIFFAVIVLIFICLVNLPIEATNYGALCIDLIHRDSPNSPLYKPHETPMERFNNLFRRSYSRLNSLNMISFNPNEVQSDTSSDNGHYLMKFSIGTPPQEFYGIVDTGSDLMWAQCLPCEQCYKQLNPIYNPTILSSYKEISCQSEQCHLLDTVSCSSQQLCNYTYGYGGSQLTKGVLATEKITFGSNSGNPTVLDDIVFGCGHNNTGGFNENEMGLVGLGGRNLSLTSQICSRLGTNKFSYCLVPFRTNPNITSKIHFGSGSEVSGDDVVSTPIVPKDDPTYHFVTLEGISVGNKFIPYNNSSTTLSKGNVFIDTGVPPTLLPQDFYNRLEQEVKNAIKLTPYQDSQLGIQLCYKSQTMVDIAPLLAAHFDGGAKVQLSPTSTFIPPPLDGVLCFWMLPVDADVGIYGNFAQSNYFIGYDLDKQIVSFKPADCTKQ